MSQATSECPSTTDRGAYGERLAESYLAERGLRCIERNFRCRQGEIDIIAFDGDVLCIVEVRSLESAAHGDPLETIGAGKIARIMWAAEFYLAQTYGGEENWPPIRFDAVGIILASPPQIRWVKEAFDASSAAGVHLGAPMGAGR